MTTKHEIEVRFDKPPEEMDGCIIVQHQGSPGIWITEHAEYVRRNWQRYTAWYDPQIGEVERPRRFVVREADGGLFRVFDEVTALYVALRIPTREAAQRIADVYEEVVG